MNKLYPSVQILLSTYNGEKYVREQLDSLKNQDYPNIKVKIRDDGSTDSTVELISKYITDNKLDWELSKDENIGVVKSFFWLLFNASQKIDFYSFCDQDDYWNKEKTSRAISLLSEEPVEIPLLYCSDVQFADSKLNPIERKFDSSVLIPSFEGSLYTNIFAGCTSVINGKTRELLISKILPDCVMHDWWMYIVTSAFGKVIFDNAKTLKYRLHDKNICGQKRNFYKNLIKLISGKIYLNSPDEISKQVESFVSLYKEELSEDHLKAIDVFFDRSITNRVRVFFDQNFWKKSAGSLAPRVKFLLNKM